MSHAERRSVPIADVHTENLLGYVREANLESATPEVDPFGMIALESFRAQCDSIPAYEAYARHVGRGPDMVRDWREVPPVPASAFKSHDLSATPQGAEAAIFETSGTTISRPGRVRLGSTALYEASLLRNFEAHLLPDGARLPAIVFGPRREDVPRSALWFMVDRAVAQFAAGGEWIVQSGEPRWETADAALARACRDGTPILLLGTTLLFMAYFERLARQASGVAAGASGAEAAGRRFSLPSGSRAMDTGGAKGLRSEFARAEVESAFARSVGIPPAHIVNEYGMAEMGSQFYDDNLRAAHERRAPLHGKRIPPWVRTRVLDPETMEEQPDGRPGLLVHYDLANLEIPLAIQTEDIGARVGDRLMLEGRLLGSEPRGCSLQFEQFLEQERPAGGAIDPRDPAADEVAALDPAADADAAP